MPGVARWRTKARVDIGNGLSEGRLEDLVMGNIRQTYIKRVAMELLRKHDEVFTDNFQVNKELVDELTDIQSKELRNRIAGYTTRLKQQDNLILH